MVPALGRLQPDAGHLERVRLVPRRRGIVAARADRQDARTLPPAAAGLVLDAMGRDVRTDGEVAVVAGANRRRVASRSGDQPVAVRPRGRRAVIELEAVLRPDVAEARDVPVVHRLRLQNDAGRCKGKRKEQFFFIAVYPFQVVTLPQYPESRTRGGEVAAALPRHTSCASGQAPREKPWRVDCPPSSAGRRGSGLQCRRE